jgi:hypothetical protein
MLVSKLGVNQVQYEKKTVERKMSGSDRQRHQRNGGCLGYEIRALDPARNPTASFGTVVRKRPYRTTLPRHKSSIAGGEFAPQGHRKVGRDRSIPVGNSFSLHRSLPPTPSWTVTEYSASDCFAVSEAFPAIQASFFLSPNCEETDCS